jgi:LysM repeat protein
MITSTTDSSLAQADLSDKWRAVLYWYNLGVLDTWSVKLVSLGFLFVAFSACSSSQGEADHLSTPEIKITPYHTPTPIVVSAAQTEEATPTSLPLPTPTPYKYTIVTGDTLLVIAARFGLTLDELMAANPEVDPYLLSVGAELIIPQSEGEGSVASLGFPTPLPVGESTPHCYPTASGGLWCILAVGNDYNTPLDNLSAAVSLFDFRGIEVVSQTALPPLNVLWPGEEIPLMAFFKPPLPSWTEVQARLVTSLEVSDNDNRYLPARFENLQVQIAQNGLSALVSGTVTLQNAQVSANEIWVAVVAYDAQDHVIGARRWEGGRLEAGGSVSFITLVYSLGPPIARVEALVEAHP